MTRAQAFARNWLADVAPVRTLGAVLALVSGLGAVLHDQEALFDGSSLSHLSDRVQALIGWMEIALVVAAVCWPRLGAFAATGFFSFQRIYQNLQLHPPTLLVLVAWTGLFLIASLELSERTVPLRYVNARTRAATFLVADGILVFGLAHASWFGFNLIVQSFWNASPGLWTPLPLAVSLVVGLLLILFAVGMYCTATPSGYFLGGLVAYLMRFTQGIQKHNLYVVGFWIIAIGVAWWAKNRTETAARR